jgi:NADH:ubiquinone oxidoreductase subunit 5 (subunit L)/multisubunit Na+/H+ antiporter MnhA subunit
MYLIIVFLPLFSALVAGFFGENLGSKGVGFLTTCCISFTFLLSLIIFFIRFWLFFSFIKKQITYIK